MNKKISAIASLINKDSTIADIGCDHSYLSLILLKQQKINFAYNIDINVGPLNQGKSNLISNGFKNKCEFILNDGLKNLNLSVDYIIIAGMGANNIISILKYNTSKTNYYILQANTNTSLLRIYLKENQAEIINELLIFDSNIYYEVLLVKFSNKTNIIDEFDIFIGPIIKKIKTKELKEYIYSRINYLNSIINENVNDKIKQEFKILNKIMVEKWQKMS